MNKIEFNDDEILLEESKAGALPDPNKVGIDAELQKIHKIFLDHLTTKIKKEETKKACQMKAHDYLRVFTQRGTRFTPPNIDVVATSMRLKATLPDWHLFLTVCGYYPPPLYVFDTGYISDLKLELRGCISAKLANSVSLPKTLSKEDVREVLNTVNPAIMPAVEFFIPRVKRGVSTEYFMLVVNTVVQLEDPEGVRWPYLSCVQFELRSHDLDLKTREHLDETTRDLLVEQGYGITTLSSAELQNCCFSMDD